MQNFSAEDRQKQSHPCCGMRRLKAPIPYEGTMAAKGFCSRRPKADACYDGGIEGMHLFLAKSFLS